MIWKILCYSQQIPYFEFRSRQFLHQRSTTVDEAYNKTIGHEVTNVKVEGLQPCLQYELELWDNLEEHATVVKREEFKTIASPNESIPLSKSEVQVWKDEGPEIKIEWADRCSKRYLIKSCRVPDGCDSSHWDETEVLHDTEAVEPPSVTLERLDACGLFTVQS